MPCWPYYLPKHSKKELLLNFGGPGFISSDSTIETMLILLDLAVKILVFRFWRLADVFAGVLLETGVSWFIATTPVKMLGLLLKS